MTDNITNNNSQTTPSVNATVNNVAENPTVQKVKTNRLASTLGEIFKAKGVKLKVIGLILLVVISTAITILNLGKKASKNIPPTQSAQTNKNNVNYNPSAELDIPAYELGPSANESEKTLSDPANTVTEFLEYNHANDRESAKSLISPKAKVDTFISTMESIDSEDSLYGKSFTYNIYDTFIEKNGNLSRVSVEINTGEKQYVNVYILLWENGVWQLLDKESYEPVSQNVSEQ